MFNIFKNIEKPFISFDLNSFGFGSDAYILGLYFGFVFICYCCTILFYNLIYFVSVVEVDYKGMLFFTANSAYASHNTVFFCFHLDHCSDSF